tara:strand:+ start:7903 stop:8601 length:699 start_codon:yes stop_codon:yes gene_type:complete
MKNPFKIDKRLIREGNNQILINPTYIKPLKLDPVLNIAVLASGKGSNFEAIYKSIQSKELNANISILIANNENCLAIQKAKKFGINYIYIDHRHFKNRELYDQEIINQLKNYNIEGIVMAGWMRIVTPILINSYKNRIINIHPSLLPSFRGTNSIERALNSGVKITGCTVHKVIEEIDSGSIISQVAVSISNEETVESLTKKIQFQEHKILPTAISLAAIDWRNKIMDKNYL